MKNKLASRKFLSAVVISAIVLASGMDWISLEQDAVIQFLTIGLGWIGVEGTIDVVKVLKQFED